MLFNLQNMQVGYDRLSSLIIWRTINLMYHARRIWQNTFYQNQFASLSFMLSHQNQKGWNTQKPALASLNSK